MASARSRFSFAFSSSSCFSRLGYFDCAYPLAGIFVLALAYVLLGLIAAVAISFLCYRDWNSVD